MSRVLTAWAGFGLALLAGCGTPDKRALKKLACEQVATTIDLPSVSQLDALRKALGVAPNVDPIESCRALGVPMEASSPGGNAGEGASGDSEGAGSEPNGSDN